MECDSFVCRVFHFLRFSFIGSLSTFRELPIGEFIEVAGLVFTSLTSLVYVMWHATLGSG